MWVCTLRQIPYQNNIPPLLAAGLLIAWKFSALVVLGFGLSWALNLTPFSAITVYIDPALAIVLMLVFASSPIIGIRDCVRGLARCG